MAQYDVIVVGAGNGGMTGALTLAKAGKKVLLLEKHNVPGGCGTSFRRGRFEFEVALHQLFSVSENWNGEKGKLRKVFEELGVWDKLEFVIQDETFRLQLLDFISVPFPGSHDGFKDTLKSFAPEESEAIDRYQELCDKLSDEIYDLYDAVAADESITKERFPVIFEYGPVNAGELIDKFFEHPVLKGAYSTYFGYLGMPIDVAPFMTLGFLYGRGEGTAYLKGGSQMMSAAIVDEFINCGGTLKLNSCVEKIFVEDARVTGVCSDDGTVYQSDIVLCNAHKSNAYVNYIDEEWVPEELFRDLRVSTPSQSNFNLFLGLDISAEEAGIESGTIFMRTLSDRPKRYDVTLRQPGVNSMLLSCYNLDCPEASPEKTCIISICIGHNPDAWKAVGPECYHDYKESQTKEALEFLYRFYPNIRGHIEEIAVSSPITLQRYLGSANGAIYGFDTSMKDIIANKLDVDSPIKGLYFCGSSIMYGGFNTTLIGGNTVGKRILHDLAKEGK